MFTFFVTKRTLIFSFAFFICGVTCARELPIPVERAKQLHQFIPDQPSMIGPPCSDRATWTSHFIGTQTAVLRAEAEMLNKKSFPAWNDKIYQEYSVSGKRVNGEIMINDRKSWLYPLILAECFEGKGRFIPSIEKTLSELIDQPSWTWPAHDRGLRNFKHQNFDIDIVSASIAVDLAQSLYLMGEWIKPELRDRVKEALNNRIYLPFIETFRRNTSDNFWITSKSAWNIVCLKGVISSALYIIENKEQRALFLAIGEQYSQYYLESFGDDGYANEGIDYWNHGLINYVLLREFLMASSQNNVDLFVNPKFNKVVIYGEKIKINQNNIPAFGDSYSKSKIDPYLQYYLHHNALITNNLIKNKQYANDSPLFDACYFLFNKSINSFKIASPILDLSSYFEVSGVFISRAGPDSNLGIAIKAGGNGNHSHNDIGSYVVGLKDEQPIGDVGKTQYTSKTFGAERFTIAGISSWGHPVPVISGVLQDNANYVIPKFKLLNQSIDYDEFEVDMKSAYSKVDILQLTRNVAHIRNNIHSRIIIEDKFIFLNPEYFEVPIITKGNWVQIDQNTLEFWEKNQHLLVKIESSEDWRIKSETSSDEGLYFQRIAVELRRPTINGFLRMTISQKINN